MRRRVHLHGPYKKLHPGPIEIVAETVWEAIEAVTLQIKGFAPDLNGRKQIQVPGFSTIESLKAPSDVEDIHIFPPMNFGKRGLLQTIIGIVLIIVGFVTGQHWLMAIGLSMLAGGLMQMLHPQPSLTQENKSKYLPTTQNTVKIGTTIPLLYGRYRAAGHILSLEINAKNAAA